MVRLTDRPDLTLDVYRGRNTTNNNNNNYNVQSLANKTDILQSEPSNFGITSITVTWLDHRTSDDDILLQGYNIYRRHRDGDNHGGVCVYVNNIFSKRRNDLEIPNIECVWVEHFSHSKKLLVGTFYRPPILQQQYSQLLKILLDWPQIQMLMTY